jgi:outer membrane protein
MVGAIAIALLGLAAPAVAQVRLGFVDLQQALNDTQEGAAAKRRLKRMFNKRQGELDDQQNRLKRMEDDLKKQKGVLSDEAFEKRVEAYRKAFVELQTTYVQHQRDLSERETEETGRILKRMQTILAEIGERDNYTAIVEVNEGGVFYYRSSLDLTNELIRLYDERHPGGGGAKSGGDDEEEGETKTPAKGGAKGGAGAKAPAAGGKAPAAGGKAPAGDKAPAPAKAGGGGGKAPADDRRERVTPIL